MDFWGRKPENDFIRAFEEVTEGHENNHESQLSTERMEELEIQIQQDEKPIKLEPDESSLSEPERGKKKLKRELRKEALTRMEEAARTEADFEKVTQAWDKLDANRERKERYHEIKRSGDDIPLEYGRAKYGAAFPEWLNDPNYSAIQHGRNLDVIFNCTYELHQFTSHPILLKILKDLKMEYKDVLFFTIIRDEVMDTNKYLELFFPFRKLDFKKKSKDAAWFIDGDNTMLALAMTFRNEPDAQVMCFLRDYAERYDWLVQVFQDWSFTFLSSFLFYEDYDEMEEEIRDIYRAGMAAFEGIAPEYHIELRDRPTMVWDFHSLLLAIQMMFSFMLVDETATLKLCPNCYKAFFTENKDADLCEECME